jgi:ankyrin repeat protein
MSYTQVKETGLNIKNSEGDTPLHKIWSVNSDIAKLLLEDSELIRPSINLQNNYGKTLLHMRHKSDVFEILCRDHREIVMDMLTIRDRYGNTPIHSASYYGCTLLLDFLLKCPSVLADALNTTNKGGETPLHLACWRSGKDCVKRLLEEPTVIEKCLNVQELNGYTPLIYAVKYGGGGCVECLLEIPELDVEIKTKKGRTAYEYLYKIHDVSVRKMLQEHIARVRNAKLA